MMKLEKCSKIIQEMFSGEHPFKEVIDALGWMEKHEPMELYELIKDYHPKYCDESWGEINKFTLIIDLQWKL